MVSKNSPSARPRISVQRGSWVRAKYEPAQVGIYQGNPFIEALPPIMHSDEVVKRLALRPPYHASERMLAPGLRVHALHAVRQFFQPLSGHVELEQQLSTAIRLGYLARNPRNPSFWPGINRRVQATESPATAETWLDVPPSTAVGFAHLGISGSGKTWTWDRLLSFYPQVIQHTRYQGDPFSFLQLVWLKIELPQDSSVRGFCFNILQAVDEILGTNYEHLYTSDRPTVDKLIPRVSRALANHALGALIPEEVQRLSAARSASDKQMLNFLTQMINALGVPVFPVGTLGAARLLGGDFPVARRNVGGPQPWYRLAETSPDWQIFAEALWGYQYTRMDVPFDLKQPAVRALWDVSQGVIDLAVKAYALAQARAFGHTEKVTAGLIRSVAHDHFGLVAPYLAALRSGHWERIARYEDLVPLDLENALAIERRRRGQSPDSGAAAREEVIDDICEWLRRGGVPDYRAKAAATMALEECGAAAETVKLCSRAFELASTLDELGRVRVGGEGEHDDAVEFIKRRDQVSDAVVEVVDPTLGKAVVAKVTEPQPRRRLAPSDKKARAVALEARPRMGG